MAEDNRYNYEYVEQDVNWHEGTMSGMRHKKIHDSQDELFKKMGFTMKDGELYFYSQRFADMDPEMKKGLISHVALFSLIMTLTESRNNPLMTFITVLLRL